MGNCLQKEAVVSASSLPAQELAAKKGDVPAPAPAPARELPASVPKAPVPVAINALGGPVALVDTTQFPGEQARDAQLRGCRMLDTVPEPRFDAITKLMASIFKTPVSLITLIVDDRVWFKSKVGPFGACVARDGSWCNYILVPNKPEVLITEDASVDARFAGNPYVAGEPHIKFYAGAPLVGTGGVRYGTLCVVDLVPRSFSAEMYALLTNFADLVVQELERDNDSLRHLVHQATSFADNQQRMGRALSSAMYGLAMIDIRSKPWPVLYANETFAKASGQSANSCTDQGFWDQFEPAGSTADKVALDRIDASVAAGKPARVTVRSRASGALLSLTLRPAATDQLAPEKPVGVPNWVRSEKELAAAGVVSDPLNPDDSGAVGTIDPQLASCFFLAVVEPYEGLPPGTPLSSAGQHVVGSDGSSLAAPGTPDLQVEPMPRSMMPFGDHALPSALAGLELGPLIGSGSFAKVYRGFWKSRVVAVKVIDCDRPDSLAKDVLAEAVLSQGLVHSNIVRTFAYDIDSRLVEKLGGLHERGTVYIVQQHCNRGTLIDAVEKGWFSKKPWTLTSPPDVPAILRTLREVASGMAFVHSQDIIHRDLTGNNVLLTQCDEDERGFVACVADFGLARVARGGSIATDSYGTVSHMPPEVLADGMFTPAADVWSFGVLCWEMFTGGRAYVGLRAPNVVYKVMSGKGDLPVPEEAPAGYQDLMRRCLSRDNEKRPSFSEVVKSIDALLKEVCDS